jgi:hypothetical protein
MAAALYVMLVSTWCTWEESKRKEKWREEREKKRRREGKKEKDKKKEKFPNLEISGKNKG